MITAPVLLTFCSAVLYALSFPPFSCFPLMWIALAPLFIAAAMVHPGRAAAHGLLWGVVMTCGVAWCFPTMLMNYFGLSPIAGWAGLFAVGIVLAGIYSAAFAAWLSWLVHRQAANPFLVTAGWGTCEFVRVNLFGGTPWALSGYSQVTLTPLMQIADVAGPYGVGMLIAAVNAVLAGFFTPALRGRRVTTSIIGVVIACGGAFIYGQWRLSQTFTTGEPVQIAIVQAAIARQFRWDPEHSSANLQRYLALTKEVAVAHPALIFWPEYAVDFSLQQESPQSEAVLGIARDLEADLILGGPHHRYGVSQISSRNSVFLVRNGQLAGRYDKVRLFPFAEDQRLTWLIPQQRAGYEPGQQLHTLHTNHLRVGAFVCFEAMDSDLVRRFALQGAEVLANPSNDDWFGYAAPARHQLDIAAVRAIENRRYLVRATATGFSAVIDPHGRVVALSKFGVPETLIAAIRPSQAQTPYQRWGDAVCWIAVVLVVTMSLSQIHGLKQNWQRR